MAVDYSRKDVKGNNSLSGVSRDARDVTGTGTCNTVHRKRNQDCRESCEISLDADGASSTHHLPWQCRVALIPFYVITRSKALTLTVPGGPGGASYVDAVVEPQDPVIIEILAGSFLPLTILLNAPFLH